MKQMTFATTKGFEVHGRATRKAEFLARNRTTRRLATVAHRKGWSGCCGCI